METSINGETEPLLPISDAEPLLSASDVPNGSSHAVPSHIYAIEVAAALIGAGCSFLYLIVAIEYISSTTSTSPGPGCIVQRMVHRDKEYTIAVITAVGVLSAFSWLAAVVAGRVGGHSGITQHSTLHCSFLFYFSFFFWWWGGNLFVLFCLNCSIQGVYAYSYRLPPLMYACVRFTAGGGNRLQCSVGY